MSALLWKDLTADQKRAVVKDGILAGDSYAKLADKMGAPSRNAISSIASVLRTHGELPMVVKKRARKVVPPAKPRQTRETTGSWGGTVVKAQAKLDREKKSKASPVLDAVNIAKRLEGRAEAKGLVISRAAAFDPLPGCEPVSFASGAGCKWPVDGTEGNGMLICGASRADHNYCAVHQRLAYQPKRERAA